LRELKANSTNNDLAPLRYQTRLGHAEVPPVGPSKPSVIKTSFTRSHKEPHFAPPVKEREQFVAPEQTIKEADLIKLSIRERQQRWDFFLSQQGNYMFAPNLENGLKDIIRDIRQLSIRHPRGALVAFDLLMLAANTLYRFTVEGADSSQDFHSVPLKLQAWIQMDQFGALLLRGLGPNYDIAEKTLSDIELQRRKLEETIAERLPELSFDCWFQQTAAGLEKCIAQKQMI
jgi:hypothetical protein